jgi:hypothetical protein
MNNHLPLPEIVLDKERCAPVSARKSAGVLAAIVCAAALGCQGSPDPSSPVVLGPTSDEKVLLALDCYDPMYQIDENGRVIKLRLIWGHLPVSALAEVGKLTELQSIDLAFSTVNDECLAQLENLHQLRTLGLGGTEITDKGLLHLEKLPSLQYLWAPKQSVTSAGVERLKEARPDLNVYLQ